MKKIRRLAASPRLPNTRGGPGAEALAEDAKFENILRDARSRPPSPLVTEKSMREGAALMAKFRRGSLSALMRRIECKELLTREELVERLGGNRRWICAALRSERLFSIQTPSGAEYFPAFYADAAIDLRALGKVAKVLSGLPGPSRYYFFVSKSFVLRTTPLDAIAKGRVRDVLTVAAGFAMR